MLNPIRYRSYYYDSETGYYYLQSRYYDPEIGRFISADSQINNDFLGTNIFAYCGNNPVNNIDTDGHLFGMIVGAAIGGLIGGIGGAISAACKGKSVLAGAVTGAVSGAIIGGVCGAAADLISAGALSIAAGIAISASLCGTVSAGSNAVNQYWNYRIERDNQTKNSKKTSNSSKNSSSGINNQPKSSNGKIASECSSFLEYVDFKSIAISGITSAAFAPLGLGANCVVNSAFSDIGAGAINTMSNILSNFAVGGSVSILQSIIDLF